MADETLLVGAADLLLRRAREVMDEVAAQVDAGEPVTLETVMQAMLVAETCVAADRTIRRALAEFAALELGCG